MNFASNHYMFKIIHKEYRLARDQLLDIKMLCKNVCRCNDAGQNIHKDCIL